MQLDKLPWAAIPALFCLNLPYCFCLGRIMTLLVVGQHGPNVMLPWIETCFGTDLLIL